ncbi:MAG: heme-binding protein, partial [Mycobacterium sp.]|nr:heme-binding protein [Mycobacterium sp.]
PLTNMSTQCKLPISIPQAMGMMQQAQAGGGLPAPPGGALPLGGPAAPAATPPAATPPGVTVGSGGTAPAPTAGSPLPGQPRGNTVG